MKKRDTGRIYACKVLDKKLLLENDEVEATKMEKEVLRRVSHPFIVGLKYSFQTPTKVYLVLDFINGGELFFHLRKEKRFSEERCRLYTAELVLALEHLHSLGIIYRDLKPENILLQEDGHLCLTDFGLAKTNIFSGDQTYTFCGTPEYLAPEILRVSQRDGKGYDKAVDWWSLGILLYEMLHGKIPFSAPNVNDMYKKILSAPLNLPDSFLPDTKTMLRGLLERDPQDRLGSGYSDGEELKSHPYFKNVKWQQVLEKEVVPIFKPAIKSDQDVSNFDQMFTSETISETPLEDSTFLGVDEQARFRGFSFNGTKD